MARNTITRTIKATRIDLMKVIKGENGFELVEIPPIFITGKVAEREIQKAVAEKGNGVTVTGTSEFEKVYEMDIDFFMANAREVEPKTDKE